MRGRPTTIPAYIKAAPPTARPHLRKLYAILKRAAPKAKQTIKWGNPFFVNPRFLFAFSAHKEHLNFTPMAKGLDEFRAELKKYKSTKHMLQVRYDEPLPADLIRRIARRQVARRKNDGGAFW